MMKSQLQSSLIPRDRKLVLEVLRLRYWQHIMNEDLKKNLFRIPIHVAIGHEAIAVAVSNVMGPDDQLVLSHRNMAYNLARAGSLQPIYDEYMLSPTSVSGGKLGSMNLANPDWGVVYSSSILGNSVPVACGLALGKQVLGQPGVVINLIGDGAVEEGSFYEGLVFAKSHQLGSLIIIENNDHSMWSTIEERRAPISFAHLCAAVDIPFKELSGNSVLEYRSELERIRATVEASTPACIEVHLAALNQHSGPTPGWPTDPKSISIEDGLIVEETEDDPVYVLQRGMDTRVFDELVNQVMTEGWTDSIWPTTSQR